MQNNGDIALKMVGISKHFSGVLANDNINFELKTGEVHGLLGENGAGKTTLMNVLYGLHQPDAGEIYINSHKVEITSAHVANELGLGMVHQHFMLVDNLSVIENIVLGLKPKRPPLLDLDSSSDRFIELVGEYGLTLDPSTPVWQLPVGDQQWLEILKLLFRDAQILILDEPTAVLAPSQVEELFEALRRLTSDGRSIVFISHKLEEIKEIADRVTVLRDGHVVDTVDPRETTPIKLGQMMVGRDVFLDRRERAIGEIKKEVLVIKKLNCLDDREVQALRDFDLTISSGEIVGVAGVDGNGQRELAECIAGLRRPTDGSIQIDGKKVSGVETDTTLVGYIPEDRRKTGLVLNFNIAENLFLKTISNPPYTNKGVIQWGEIRQEAVRLIDEYDIRTPSSMVPVSFLSGGNQQKVVVARELSQKPALVIASQATRGLDVGAIESVHKVLLDERNRGAAVLFISTELSEVLALSDRIIVMFEGQIMGELDAETADIDFIGELMLGHRERVEMESGGGV
jgi:simple sugar transport system ATP-binding protein